MRKWLIGGGIAVAAVVLVAAGAAFAASNAAGVETARGAARSAFAFMRGRPDAQIGGIDVPGMRGQLHEYMFSAVASALDLSSDELEARLAEGEPLPEVAAAQGISEEDLPTVLDEAQAEALQAAVADGVLTQEQADWMLEHPMMLGMLAGGRVRDGWGSREHRRPMGPGFFDRP